MEIQVSQGELMLGELMNIPTVTLIDMLCVILTGEVVLTANGAVEIEQIQRELQRRGEGLERNFQTIH
jgi:hypothetical protein